ncbi:hypothetical protein KAR91_85610 [Candidatus Pacearchaeota archaeon]|nr:hypothetical protein [Candidatus Pacearchaeota archaeon]
MAKEISDIFQDVRLNLSCRQKMAISEIALKNAERMVSPNEYIEGVCAVLHYLGDGDQIPDSLWKCLMADQFDDYPQYVEV